MTYREIVSRIQNNLNTLNKDMFIPRRFILSVVKSKGEFLMAQRFNDKSVFRETNLYDWLKCVELEMVDTVKCGKVELEKCSSAVVSKKKLPKMIWSRYGSSILMVTNVVDEKQYTIVTPSQYIKLRKTRNFEKFEGTFVIVYPDGKIAIPDATVRLINVLMYSLDEKKKDFMNMCDGEDGDCDSYWDMEFNIPDKIREVAIQEALKDISMRIQIPADENPNSDSNLKSREQ